MVKTLDTVRTFDLPFTPDFGILNVLVFSQVLLKS